MSITEWTATLVSAGCAWMWVALLVLMLRRWSKTPRQAPAWAPATCAAGAGISLACMVGFATHSPRAWGMLLFTAAATVVAVAVLAADLRRRGVRR